MRNFSGKVLGVTAAFLTPLPLFAVGEKADAIVIVADSRKASGLQAWWMNIYNESHLLFAIITIVVLPVTGLILGKLTGAAMARLGINLKARQLAEH